MRIYAVWSSGKTIGPRRRDDARAHDGEYGVAFEDVGKPDMGPAPNNDLLARKGRASARGFGAAAVVDAVAADVARARAPHTSIELDRSRPRRAASGSSRRQRRALVADGDGLSRKLYRDVLEADGYEVVLASDGLGALEAARRHDPDVAVVNLRLADLAGLELARRIASDDDRPAIPVIAVAEMYQAADEAAAQAGGCVAYLAKPISVRLLLDTVDRFVRSTGSFDNG